MQSRKLNHQFDKHSIYDCVYFTLENKWKQWNDLIEPKDMEIPKNLNPQDIIVTTIDKIRYQFVLMQNIENMIPTLFVGPTGTGKSIYIKNALNGKL